MIYVNTVLSDVDPINYYLAVALIMAIFIIILTCTLISIKKGKKTLQTKKRENGKDDPKVVIKEDVITEPKENTPKVGLNRITIEVNSCERDAFSILGKVIYFDKEKNTDDIEKLWNDLGAKYKEIAIFAKKDDHGNAVGFWGAMSDETMNFLPWKELKEGYYMAGVEVGDRIKAPKGWEKWMIPAFAYLYARVDNNYQEVFDYVIHDYIPQKGFHLVGAVQEYNCPEENGQLYLFFPIKKI